MEKKERRSVSHLAEAEMETLEVGWEWMRRRLEEKLQRLADSQGAVSPPQPASAAQGEVSEGDDHDERG